MGFEYKSAKIVCLNVLYKGICKELLLFFNFTGAELKHLESFQITGPHMQLSLTTAFHLYDVSSSGWTFGSEFGLEFHIELQSL